MDETPSIATDSTGSNTVLSPVPIFCDYCGKEIIGQPIIGGDMKEKRLCSYSCHKNDWELYHDNWFSDADPGM